ncbi:MAG TPA: amidohydrolase family protein [Spirochaetia bacterium]|nr:amidohydrolase family protein [Spirochaetia bacterium]
MRVIDSHVHFPAKKIVDDGKPEGKQESAWVAGEKKVDPWLLAERAKWKAAWRFPQPVETTSEDAEKLWAAECENYDYLKKVVFVTAGSNDAAAALVKRHPKQFIAYAHHDPFLPDAPARLEKALGEGGLSGYKILAPSLSGSIGDRSLYPLWEIAQAREVPLLVHFGIEGAAGGIANHVNINPLSIHGVAKDFPSLRIIIPHFGCGYVFETLNLCWACPNVVIDTSGSNQWMRWMPYEVNLEILFRKYYETIGPTRILFGTDSSWFPRGFATAYLDEQVRSMVYVGYSEDELDAVLYRNAAALLKLT